MTKVSKKEILDTVVDHINKNGRSTYEGACKYYSENGNMCGVGIFMKNPERIEKMYHEKTIGVICDREISLDNILKDEYNDHSLKFWQQIQRLHDAPDHWNENNNLTKNGLEKYNEILNEFVFFTQSE